MQMALTYPLAWNQVANYELHRAKTHRTPGKTCVAHCQQYLLLIFCFNDDSVDGNMGRCIKDRENGIGDIFWIQ